MSDRYVVRGTSEVWRNPHEGMRIYVLAVEEDKDESEWKSVAMFRFREHADRYCAELNREERRYEAVVKLNDPDVARESYGNTTFSGPRAWVAEQVAAAKARQQATSDGALLSASLQASMQINQAMQRQYEQMLSEQVMPAVVKHFSAFTQHKDACTGDAGKYQSGRAIEMQWLIRRICEEARRCDSVIDALCMAKRSADNACVRWPEDHRWLTDIAVEVIRDRETMATQHKDAIPPPADPGHPAPDMMDAVFGKWPGDETDEELAKALSATPAYQVRHVWDPSKFCEPTTRTWKLSSIVKPPAPSTTWAIPDDVKRRWATPNGVGSVVYEPEKPQHPNEGPVCCRKHAPIQWAFNSEVWGKLKERCER